MFFLCGKCSMGSTHAIVIEGGVHVFFVSFSGVRGTNISVNKVRCLFKQVLSLLRAFTWLILNTG